MIRLKESEFWDENNMNWTQIKPIAANILVIAAGVIVANQVQKMLDKAKLSVPSKA